MKKIYPDAKLSEIVGDKPLINKELIRNMWAYIKSHGLIHE